MSARDYGKWDHLWHLIIFDIPEVKRKQRDKFSRLLSVIGCFRIQRSVYAYPYDCRKEIVTMASGYSVASDLEVLTVPNLGRYEKAARRYYFARQSV
jgi:CRISPR-associated endonuclease Cas2